MYKVSEWKFTDGSYFETYMLIPKDGFAPFKCAVGINYMAPANKSIRSKETF